MPLDPHLLRGFEHIRHIPSFPAMFADPAAQAAFARFLEDPAPWSPPATVTTEELAAPGPQGPVRVRVYRDAEAEAPGPGLLWMHGGAFRMGDIDMNESSMLSAELARRAGAVVVTVDYRLAVDGVRYPVPLDDVVAAWEWFVGAAAGLGADPARLFIGGASAGGNLATSASMRVRDADGVLPAGMLLAYPLVHFPVPALDEEVVVEMAGRVPRMLRFDPAFHVDTMLNYLGRLTDVPAGIAPANFDLHGMPPAWLVPAEFDELRPSSDLFALQLEEVGVPVRVQLAEGQIHGHLNRTPTLPAVDRTLDFFAEALRG